MCVCLQTPCKEYDLAKKKNLRERKRARANGWKMEGRERKKNESEGRRGRMTGQEGVRSWSHCTLFQLQYPVFSVCLCAWMSLCVCHWLHMYKWACAGDFGRHVRSLNYGSVSFFTVWNRSLFLCCSLVAFACCWTVSMQLYSSLMTYVYRSVNSYNSWKLPLLSLYCKKVYGDFWQISFFDAAQWEEMLVLLIPHLKFYF